jgi:hypothetical protein
MTLAVSEAGGSGSGREMQVLRLAAELIVAPKAGATNSDASLRMTLLYFWMDLR